MSRVTDLLLHMVVSCNRLSELRKGTSHAVFVTDYRIYELALRSSNRLERLFGASIV